MSIDLMTQIWKSDAYDGGTLLVALALADWANDEGGSIFPKVATIGKKARLSERQVQNCLRTLRADGVLIQVAPPRRGRGTEYRLDLAPITKMGRKNCTANSSGETGVTKGVKPASGVGTKPISPPKEEPPIEPPKNRHSYAREDALTRWPDVWAAFQTWPKLPDTATEQRAKVVWVRMLAELPDADALIRAIHAQGDKLRAGGKRGGWATAPHNWLERDRGWADAAFALDRQREASEMLTAKRDAILMALGADILAKLRRAGLRETDIDRLEGVTFDRGPPARFVCSKPLTRSWLAAHSQKLDEVWPGIILEVASDERRRA